MTDQVLYFWFCWLFWILVTFFMEKNHLRTYSGIWTLSAIICADFYLQVHSIAISFPFLLILIGAAGLLGSLKRWFYHYAAAFVTAIGYAAFLFWETISPVWLVLPRSIIITIIFSLLISILARETVGKIAVCLFGMAAGELFYMLTLSSYGMFITVGDKHSLICLFYVLLFFVFLHVLQKGKEKLLLRSAQYKEKMMEVVK